MLIPYYAREWFRVEGILVDPSRRYRLDCFPACMFPSPDYVQGASASTPNLLHFPIGVGLKSNGSLHVRLQTGDPDATLGKLVTIPLNAEPACTDTNLMGSHNSWYTGSRERRVMQL